MLSATSLLGLSSANHHTDIGDGNTKGLYNIGLDPAII